jgi:hypothetical protein
MVLNKIACMQTLGVVSFVASEAEKALNGTVRTQHRACMVQNSKIINEIEEFNGIPLTGCWSTQTMPMFSLVALAARSSMKNVELRRF